MYNIYVINISGELKMKKIDLIKCVQKHKNFYMAKIDPRDVIKLVDVPEKDTDQKIQRPWKEKRVKEISKYCAGNLNISDDKEKKKKYAKGIIPNCPILNILPPLEIKDKNNYYYLNFPETEEEFNSCFKKIQILDGQHRSIAFLDEYISEDFKDSEVYEMGYIIFDSLTLEEKREIFMISNDKQEKVESNVLRQIKKWLGLLSEHEEQIYLLIERLNSEDISPLKGRIIIGGKKVKKGIKLVQLSKILRMSKTFDILKSVDSDKQIIPICNYFKAWEKIYSGMFNNPRHTLGKISGFRYVLYLFPDIFEILKEKGKSMTTENIEPLLQDLLNYKLPLDFFEDEETRLVFRAETSTIAQARMHGSELKKLCLKKDEVYNPLNIN